MKTTDQIHNLLIDQGFKVDFATNDEHDRAVTGYKKGTEEITIVDNYDYAITKDYRNYQTIKSNVTAGGTYDPEVANITFNCIKKETLK